eukprot:4846963-Prymnesium_polylepis.1
MCVLPQNCTKKVRVTAELKFLRYRGTGFFLLVTAEMQFPRKSRWDIHNTTYYHRYGACPVLQKLLHVSTIKVVHYGFGTWPERGIADGDARDAPGCSPRPLEAEPSRIEPP